MYRHDRRLLTSLLNVTAEEEREPLQRRFVFVSACDEMETGHVLNLQLRYLGNLARHY